MQLGTLFFLGILIISVVIHEVSHGYVADLLGDPTARLSGRLTLNPLRHLDWLGSVIIPGILIFLGGFVFGWAKPVPYNPYNLRGGRWGPALVAAAGPGSNLLIALVFAVIFRLGTAGVWFNSGAAELISVIVLLNIMLAIFNLIPVPPLDGSKILFAVLPYRWQAIEDYLNRYQFIVFIILLFVLMNSDFLNPLVTSVFQIFIG